MQYRFSLIATLTVLALAPTGLGCGGRGGTALDESTCAEDGSCACETGRDCSFGLACIDGRCQRPESVAGTGAFAELCAADEECASALCVLAGDGTYGRCSRPCAAGSCPDGWRCAGDELGRGRCVEDTFRQCLPCASDTDCHPAGAATCVRPGGSSSGFCAQGCDLEARCPTGYRCLGAARCEPIAGSCGVCAPGVERGCLRAGAAGVCHGVERCVAGQFEACDAREPVSEVCNGRDDDCDGRVDGEDPGLEPLAVDGFPACAIGDADNCRGTWTCTVAQGGVGVPDWACRPAAPQVEVCNQLDDDCDDATDEDFRDPEGRYVDVAHCGACNRDCRVVVANLATTDGGEVAPGAVECALIEGVPTCVPRLCAPGRAPAPEVAPIACELVLGLQCLECARDEDCAFESNRCVALEGGQPSGCLQGCALDAPYPGCTGRAGERGCCPEGSTCRAQFGRLLCVPNGGTCGCQPGREGRTRPCLRSGSNGTECTGAQTCERVGDRWGWSACTAEGVTLEICNGGDDDCDGQIDETFFNTQGSGTYDTDAHCGRCFNSCLVLPRAQGRCEAGAGPGCVIDRCLEAGVPGGGPCRGENDCEAGFRCDRDLYQCVRACTNDAECDGQRCVEGRCGRACSTDEQCRQAFGEAMTCLAGVCGVRYRFTDLDQEVANGCECPTPLRRGDDPPDRFESFPEAGRAYLDRNCDGIDGVLARSLFVRAGSNGTGTRASPFGTIGQALNAFNPQQHEAILVAGGTYAEALRLRAGAPIYGGYSATFFERDIARLPTLIAPPAPNTADPPAPVWALGLGSIETVLSGVVIRGWDIVGRARPGGDGASTVALRVERSPGLVLANVLVRAGSAGDGGPGAAGTSGADGTQGANGNNATECRTASCSGESQPGGTFGRNASCASARGNPGGGAFGNQTQQPYTGAVGKNGRGGTNATYTNTGDPSFANLCKYDCLVPADLEGDDASSGNAGSVGRGGRGCPNSAGRLVSNGWSPIERGARGTGGTDGDGGGGGGAGGGVRNANAPGCTVGNRVGDLGATGGGGGAGGCGGAGGQGGGSGGASIGVLLVAGAAPTFQGTIIELGSGGAGGDGGDGGRGGLGGQGGRGGVSLPPAWCGGSAGRGGRGGNGGPGGGGGGGCGGPAYGVAGPGLVGPTLPGVVFRLSGTGGGAGGGGRSPAGSSAAGVPGTPGRVETVMGL